MKNDILDVVNLSVNYGTVSALVDINLAVKQGEYLGIIGPNGGGKSTLLKTMIGLINPLEGQVTINGKAISENRGIIGYVPQSAIFDRRFPITVKDAILTGCIKKNKLLFHRYSDDDLQQTNKLIEMVGLESLKDRQVSALSGGEFQKMLIARALVMDPLLLFLDEPTANVDSTSREQIFSLLAQLNQKITIILVTHDLLAISSQVKRLACLNRTLIYHGEPQLTEPTLNSLYGCPVDLIAHGVPHRVLQEHSEVIKNV